MHLLQWAKSKTTTINRTILENAVYTACTMECNHTWPVLFIVVVLDFARTVADGSYTLSLFYALLPVAINLCYRVLYLIYLHALCKSILPQFVFYGVPVYIVSRWNIIISGANEGMERLTMRK